MDWSRIRCVVFDWGGTLSSEPYFRISPPDAPNWQEILHEEILSPESGLFDDWMEGKLGVDDIAGALSGHTALSAAAIADLMREGCRGLKLNSAVAGFARSVKQRWVKSTLVTGNIDVFSEIIVPDLGLEDLFDVIVNSWDYRETRKELLCEMAFRRLGDGIGFENTLFIEDNARNVDLFRRRGGMVHHYVDDEGLLAWLAREDLQ